MRHVAIGGVSFSGSTIFSYVLGSLPNCRSAGESHWLIDPSANGTLLGCCQCGQQCRVLTPAFRESLSGDQTEWYKRIGRRLGADTVISSDKVPKILDRLDPQRDFDLVVIFKQPTAQYGSYRKAMLKQGQPFNLDGYLATWIKFYEAILDYKIRGRTIFVSSAEFQNSPKSLLPKLCNNLDIRFDESCLQYWEADHHTVGGNFNPYSRLKSDPTLLPVRPQATHALADDEYARIHSNTRAQALAERLLELAAK